MRSLTLTIMMLSLRSGDGYKPMGTGAWRYLKPNYLEKDEAA